jgi:hypothetical protein
LLKFMELLLLDKLISPLKWEMHHLLYIVTTSPNSYSI